MADYILIVLHLEKNKIVLLKNDTRSCWNSGQFTPALLCHDILISVPSMAHKTLLIH